jgi:hypothetical protein
MARLTLILTALLWSAVSFAQTVHTNMAGEAFGITGLDVDGTLYNITSFDSTGAGEVFIWPDAASANNAAEAVNATLNGANIFAVAAGGASKLYHCAGRTTANVSDSAASTSEPTTFWTTDTVSAPWVCGLAGLDYHMTWQVVSAGSVQTNPAGQAVAIGGLDIGGTLYNVTSFDSTGTGEVYFWPDAASATAAADAVNAVLNGANVFEVASGGISKAYHCVGRTTGDVKDSAGSGDDIPGPWESNTVAAGFACGLGGLDYHMTWELALGSVAAAMDILPDDINNVVHTNHDGGPESSGLNDLIPVVVLNSSKLLGDPVDLDTSTINPATVIFGPNQASIAPDSQPVFNVDYDNDGMNDAKFEFLMGDTGLTCNDTDAIIVGTTAGGQVFEGSDSITTDCDAGCH